MSSPHFAWHENWQVVHRRPFSLRPDMNFLQWPQNVGFLKWRILKAWPRMVLIFAAFKAPRRLSVFSSLNLLPFRFCLIWLSPSPG